MNKKLLDDIRLKKSKGIKSFAVLLDPDHISEKHITNVLTSVQPQGFDYFFIGGSLVSETQFEQKVKLVKSLSNLPLVIFPGNHLHISSHADGILLLSLISGRNAEFLIGQHVTAATRLKESGLEIIPTGYMIIDSGKPTTVSYISNTFPIPNNKPDIASVTAMAGEMLGLQLIYMDAGSGAATTVTPEMVKKVAEAVNIPIVVGGGIDTTEKAQRILEAGADVIVVGNKIESNPGFVKQIAETVTAYNSKNLIKS